MSNDIPYMNLSGKDIEPNRDDVFHLTFPAEWAHSDIQSLFFPFGGVFIYWLLLFFSSSYLRHKGVVKCDVRLEFLFDCIRPVRLMLRNHNTVYVLCWLQLHIVWKYWIIELNWVIFS